MNIVIAGCRDFMDFPLLIKASDRIIKRLIGTSMEEITIISGKARGADSLGEKYAKLRGYKVDDHPADWTRYGKRAGFIRNEEMAKVGDVLIAFWDMQSKGTRNMINLAKEHGLEIYVVDFNNRRIMEGFTS